MFHCRQNGHCGSSKTVRVTGAAASPRVSPCCGTPVKVDVASVPPPAPVVVGELLVVDDEPEPPPATTITTTTATAAAASAPASVSRRFLATGTGCPNRHPAPPWKPAERARGPVARASRSVLL